MGVSELFPHIISSVWLQFSLVHLLWPLPHQYSLCACIVQCTVVPREAVALKCLIRLGCLEQRQAVYIVTFTLHQLPVAYQLTCKALYEGRSGAA